MPLCARVHLQASAAVDPDGSDSKSAKEYEAKSGSEGNMSTLIGNVLSDNAYKLMYNITRDRNVTMVTNETYGNSTTLEPEEHWILSHVQLIKVIVLVVVVGILILSTCKIVFRTFSKYASRKEEGD